MRMFLYIVVSMKIDLKNKAVVWSLVSLLVLAVVYYLASSVVPRVLVSVSQAGVGVRVSLADSYVIGEKILAKADGEDKCIVNVFLMDKDGRPVPGKTVGWVGMEDVGGNSGVTDKNGRAIFESVSSEEGQFKIEAVVEGVMLPQGVTVTFRN